MMPFLPLFNCGDYKRFSKKFFASFISFRGYHGKKVFTSLSEKSRYIASISLSSNLLNTSLAVSILMLSIHVASASIDCPNVSTADFQFSIGSVPFLKNIGISILPVPNGLGKRYGCDIFSAAFPLRTDAHFHQVMGRQCCGTGRISLSSFFL